MTAWRACFERSCRDRAKCEFGEEVDESAHGETREQDRDRYLGNGVGIDDTETRREQDEPDDPEEALLHGHAQGQVQGRPLLSRSGAATVESPAQTIHAVAGAEDGADHDCHDHVRRCQDSDHDEELGGQQ